MKKFIKVTLIILVILCLFMNYAYAENNVIQEEIETQIDEETENQEDNNENQNEKSLDDLQIEKNELENELENSNSQIGFIQEELSNVVIEISELTQKICDKELEIDTLTAQEKDLQDYIKKAEIELKNSNERYLKQKELLEKRLIAMYEMGNITYLDVLLNSKSIADFISNYYIINEIANKDNELLEIVNAEKKYNKKVKDSLDTKKNMLIVSRESIEKAQIALSNMLIIKDKRIKDLTEEELELQQSIEEYQNQIKEIETEIRVLALANVGEVYVGGTMAWPVPGYTRITSSFGMRTHPITGVYKLHTGVDIGAPYGSNFIAANDGLVTYAGYNTAYGNMVIIDHGGGITTLYAHGSEILVGVGDTVFQGTPILKVGSTGYSTGPHAHFEVRINGEYVEPLNYITSYNNTQEISNQEDYTKEDDKRENITIELNDNE